MKTTKTTNRKTKLLYALVLLAVMATCALPAEGAIVGEPGSGSPAQATGAADANGASQTTTAKSNTESGFSITLAWVSFIFLDIIALLVLVIMGITKRLNCRLEKTYSQWLEALYVCLLALLSVSMPLSLMALNPPLTPFWAIFQLLFIIMLVGILALPLTGTGLSSSQNDMKNADKLIKGILSFARRIVKEDKAGALARIMHLQPPCSHESLYFLSIEAGSIECLKILVDSDYLKGSENIWRKGLHHALKHANMNTPQIVEILLAKDKNIVNEKDNSTGGTALHVLMLQWRNTSKPLQSSLLEILLKHGADPSIKNIYKRTPLDEVLESSAGLGYDEAKSLIAGAAAALEQKDDAVSKDSKKGQEEK